MNTPPHATTKNIWARIRPSDINRRLQLGEPPLQPGHMYRVLFGDLSDVDPGLENVIKEGATVEDVENILDESMFDAKYTDMNEGGTQLNFRDKHNDINSIQLLSVRSGEVKIYYNIFNLMLFHLFFVTFDRLYT